MTQPLYPFTLPKPSGYADGIVPSGAELQDMQTKVAVAADGRVWTDLAAFKNWKHTSPIPSIATPTNHAVCFDPVSKRWLAFGTSGSTAIGAWTRTGSKWNGGLAPGGAAQAGKCLFANSAGVILMGLHVDSAGTDKIVESTDGGDNWTVRNIGASDTGDINSIVYVAALNLWLASKHTTDTGIFSSTDRATWTKRTTTAGCLIVRENSPSTRILAIGTGGTAGPGYTYSDDGITWTAQTFPVNCELFAPGVWSDHYGKFFVSRGGNLYSSTTGLTGSWTLVSSGSTAGNAVFGRVLFRADGSASIDGGVTWGRVLDTDLDVEFHAFAGRGVVAIRSGDDAAYVSEQLGF